jgi:hypothetical protein
MPARVGTASRCASGFSSDSAKPGRSGNPKGRPKGAKNRPPQLNEERLKTIIMEEAYRGIKVNDGERQITVSMAKAVVRAIAMKAVKGDHRSQRLFAELINETERANKALHDRWMNSALDYKKSWEEAITQARRRGLPDPDPVPHPDHIDIDIRTGEVVIDGPFTLKERDAGRQIVACIIDTDEEIRHWQKVSKRSRSEEGRAQLADLLESARSRRVKLWSVVERKPWLMREWQNQTKAAKLLDSE